MGLAGQELSLGRWSNCVERSA